MRRIGGRGPRFLQERDIGLAPASHLLKDVPGRLTLCDVPAHHPDHSAVPLRANGGALCIARVFVARCSMVPGGVPGRHRKGLAAGADRGPIQCPSGPRPNSPQSRLAPAKFRELPAPRGPLLLFGAEFGVVKRALLTPSNPARSMDYRADRHRIRAPINTCAPAAVSSQRCAIACDDATRDAARSSRQAGGRACGRGPCSNIGPNLE